MCLCMYMLMLLYIVITGAVNLRSYFSPSVPFSFIIPYMSLIVVFDESGKALEVRKDYECIKERLASIGVRFERWETNRELPWSATQEEVLQALELACGTGENALFLASKGFLAYRLGSLLWST